MPRSLVMLSCLALRPWCRVSFSCNGVESQSQVLVFVSVSSAGIVSRSQVFVSCLGLRPWCRAQVYCPVQSRSQVLVSSLGLRSWCPASVSGSGVEYRSWVLVSCLGLRPGCRSPVSWPDERCDERCDAPLSRFVLESPFCALGSYSNKSERGIYEQTFKHYFGNPRSSR